MEQGTRNKEQGTGGAPLGFKQLFAWQRGDDLASEIYAISEEMDPRHRWLGLQMVRAAASVTANIAEGYGRSNLADYLRFLEFACGSLNEVENFLHFAERNRIMPAERLKLANELRAVTGNMLFGLTKSLRSKQRNGGKWQRGLIKESNVDYEPTSGDDSLFRVPSSKFLADDSSPIDIAAPEYLEEEAKHA